MKRRTLALSSGLAALAFTTVASGTTPRAYVLKRPAHEHCKRHYARAIKRVKVRRHGKTVRVRRVWCVYRRASTSPPASLPPTSPTPPDLIKTYTVVKGSALEGTPVHFTVRGGIYYGPLFLGELKELIGQPITYTIRDATTGQQIGSFVGLSNEPDCSVVYKTEGGTQVYTGQAVSPYAGCALGTVTAPAGHVVRFRGSFAGNATYAPSVSNEEPLHS